MSVTLGRQVCVNTPLGRTEATAVGLDDNGGLRLRNSAGEITSVLSGEIEMI